MGKFLTNISKSNIADLYNSIDFNQIGNNIKYITGGTGAGKTDFAKSLLTGKYRETLIIDGFNSKYDKINKDLLVLEKNEYINELEYLLEFMVENKMKILIIDEFSHVVNSMKDSNALERFFRECRIKGILVILISQSKNDFKVSDTLRGIFSL